MTPRDPQAPCGAEASLRGQESGGEIDFGRRRWYERCPAMADGGVRGILD